MYKQNGNSGALSISMFLVTALLLMAYFGFAAIQGDYGHFRRNQVNAEATFLQTELAQLQTTRGYLENKLKGCLINTLISTFLMNRPAKYWAWHAKTRLS